MPTDANAGIDDPGANQRRAPGLSARALRLTVTVLTVVFVLTAGTATWLWTKADAAEERQPGAGGRRDRRLAVRAEDGQGRRREVRGVHQGRQRAADHQGQDEEQPGARRIEQKLAAAKVKGEGQVLMTAIGDADSDSATVLVTHDASVSTSQGDMEHHYRWTVDVVKVDGTSRRRLQPGQLERR